MSHKRVVILKRNVGEERLQRSDGKECCREVEICCRSDAAESFTEAFWRSDLSSSK